MNHGQKQKNKEYSPIDIITQHWNKGSDSLNLYINISIPINKFVFTKYKDHFKSNISLTLVISDANSNLQIYRETWEESLTEFYHHSTRDKQNLFTAERNYLLLPGEYKLFLNVQDEDSRENWKQIKKIELEEVSHLSSSLLFIKNNLLEFKRENMVMEQIDTLWLRTQVNFSNTFESDLLYSIRMDEECIDSGKIALNRVGIDSLYYLPIPFDQKKRGKYEIEVEFLEEIQKTTFFYGIEIKNYWTDDINEIIEVMKYILPYSEYKLLNEKNDSEKWENIKSYWEKRDPNPETLENELLVEFNERVRFSNKHFSILMNGWKSDRGRIYIIYGEPQKIDDSYDNNMGYHYQKWNYPHGKEFIFIDRSMSGDYSLYNEKF